MVNLFTYEEIARVALVNIDMRNTIDKYRDFQALQE